MASLKTTANVITNLPVIFKRQNMTPFCPSTRITYVASPSTYGQVMGRKSLGPATCSGKRVNKITLDTRNSLDDISSDEDSDPIVTSLSPLSPLQLQFNAVQKAMQIPGKEFAKPRRPYQVSSSYFQVQSVPSRRPCFGTHTSNYETLLTNHMAGCTYAASHWLTHVTTMDKL